MHALFVTTMIDVFLLLGSNLGDREMFLRQAVDKISQALGPIAKASGLYETQSWGKTDLPDYINQVIVVQTDLPAQNVLETVLAIETEIGRVRHEKWGSRIIDIDILFYGDEVIEEPGLTVPHPQLHNRRFTLEPLGEIAPKLFHPVIRKNVETIKKELTDSLVVKKL